MLIIKAILTKVRKISSTQLYMCNLNNCIRILNIISNTQLHTHIRIRNYIDNRYRLQVRLAMRKVGNAQNINTEYNIFVSHYFFLQSI